MGLGLNLSKVAVKLLVNEESGAAAIGVERRGENYGMASPTIQVWLAINSFNYRLITVNRVME